MGAAAVSCEDAFELEFTHGHGHGIRWLRSSWCRCRVGIGIGDRAWGVGRSCYHLHLRFQLQYDPETRKGPRGPAEAERGGIQWRTEREGEGESAGGCGWGCGGFGIVDAEAFEEVAEAGCGGGEVVVV